MFARQWMMSGMVWVALMPNLVRAEPAADARPDLSTPKAAAVAFMRALESGEVRAIKAVTLGSDDDYRLMSAVASAMRATRDLQKAANNRFGKAGDGIVPGQSGDPVDEISESKVKETGDTALLARKEDPEGRSPLKLKKTDGQWKIDLAALPDKRQINQALPAMRATQRAMEQATADIKAGKYKTAEEAKEVVQKQLMQAATPPEPPRKSEKKPAK
jgi:hypothetical protein